MRFRTEEADVLTAAAAQKSKRQQQLAEVLNSIENQQNKAKRPKLGPGQGGDSDIPYLDELKQLKNAKKPMRTKEADLTDRFVSFKDAMASSRRAVPDNDVDMDDAFGGDSDSGAANSVDMEAEEFLAEATAATAAKKAAREDRKRQAQDMRESSRASAYSELEDELADGKRKIDRQIEKNTGLSKKVQAKKAKDRNPRVKRKVKYQDALKRRKGAVQELRDKTQKYSGEQTGIKSNVVRSVKLT